MCDSPKEALKYYEKGIAIMENLKIQSRLYDPNDLATAYMNRGNALGDVGKHAEALDDYGKCIRIREDLQKQGRLYDWPYDLGSAWLNKGILLADGLHDTDGALAIFNHAISLLEAEEKLSYNAERILDRLRYLRDRLTGKTDSNPSIQTMLEALSDAQLNHIDAQLNHIDAQLNHIIDMIAEDAGEDGAEFVEALRQLDRSSLIDVLSEILQQ